MHKFSGKSKERLETCHKDLQLIMTEAIQNSMVDFGIAEGHRSLERQKLLFDAGKSRIDGISKKGKHNYSPSLAVDIYAFVNGKASWDVSYLSYLGGVITATAAMLYEEGEISHKVRWGGNWTETVK